MRTRWQLTAHFAINYAPVERQSNAVVRMSPFLPAPALSCNLKKWVLHLFECNQHHFFPLLFTDHWLNLSKDKDRIISTIQHLSRWINHSNKQEEQFWNPLFFNSSWQKGTIKRSALKMTLIATISPKDRSSKFWQRIAAAAAVSCNCHIKTLQESQKRIFRQTGTKGKHIKTFLYWINIKRATLKAPGNE